MNSRHGNGDDVDEVVCDVVYHRNFARSNFTTLLHLMIEYVRIRWFLGGIEESQQGVPIDTILNDLRDVDVMLTDLYGV